MRLFPRSAGLIKTSRGFVAVFDQRPGIGGEFFVNDGGVMLHSAGRHPSVVEGTRFQPSPLFEPTSDAAELETGIDVTPADINPVETGSPAVANLDLAGEVHPPPIRHSGPLFAVMHDARRRMGQAEKEHFEVVLQHAFVLGAGIKSRRRITGNQVVGMAPKNGQ